MPSISCRGPSPGWLRLRGRILVWSGPCVKWRWAAATRLQSSTRTLSARDALVERSPPMARARTARWGEQPAPAPGPSSDRRREGGGGDAPIEGRNGEDQGVTFAHAGEGLLERLVALFGGRTPDALARRRCPARNPPVRRPSSGGVEHQPAGRRGVIGGEPRAKAGRGADPHPAVGDRANRRDDPGDQQTEANRTPESPGAIVRCWAGHGVGTTGARRLSGGVRRRRRRSGPGPRSPGRGWWGPARTSVQSRPAR